jgi:hypothetical protein
MTKLGAVAPALGVVAADLDPLDIASLKRDVPPAKAALLDAQVALDMVPTWPASDVAVANLNQGLDRVRSALNRAGLAFGSGDAAGAREVAATLGDGADLVSRGGQELQLLTTHVPSCPPPTAMATIEPTVGPTASPVVDAATAYSQLADRANTRFQDLGLPQPGTFWVGTVSQERAATAALLAIEDDAAAELSATIWPVADSIEATELVSRVDAVRARLRADPNGENLGLTSIGELAAQMVAVYELRAKLGLPPRDAQKDIL